MFKNQPFKLELIKELAGGGLSVYATGARGIGDPKFNPADSFIDLCRGGHVQNASEINPDAFKLTKTAGAYWRGDEKNRC